MKQAGVFSYRLPQAGAICYARYDLDINSSDLAERLRAEQSVLIVPGDHFGMDGYVRIGYGNPREQLTAALGRMRDCLVSLGVAGDRICLEIRRLRARCLLLYLP